MESELINKYVFVAQLIFLLRRLFLQDILGEIYSFIQAVLSFAIGDLNFKASPPLSHIIRARELLAIANVIREANVHGSSRIHT